MSNWVDLVNFAVVVGGLMVALLGFLLNLRSRHMERWSIGFFMLFFSILIAYISMDLVSQISLGLLGSDFAILSRLAVFLESLFSSILMPLLTVYLLHCAGEKIKKSPTLIIVLILWGIYFIMLIFTQFTTDIYYITEENVYCRGVWYPVLLIPPALLMVLNLLAVILRRKKFSGRQFMALLVYHLIPLFCMLIQMAFYGLLMIVVGTSVAAFYLFLKIHADQTDQYYRQREENERLKTEILLAEIKPHFIFNSLTAIRSYLDEPEKAEEAINHFVGFLRGSIDLVEESGCIRAEREFETVNNYLYMEKQRFGDRLQIITDIKDQDFQLPAFSVQILVENAVNHGIRQTAEGRGTVTIRSFETGEDHVVEVEDDGIGIGSEKEEDQEDHAHIGLVNTRKRLAMLCKGVLEIESGSERGTLARIRIPAALKKHKICEDVNFVIML